jgi:hypothetical protein
MRRIVLATLMPAACVALVACDDAAPDTSPTRAPDAVRAESTETPAAAEELVGLDAPLVLAEFEGYADPASGEFRIERVDPVDIASQIATRRANGGLVTIDQSLPAASWCTGTIRTDPDPLTNPPNSFQLYTIPGSIAGALAADPFVVPPQCDVPGSIQLFYASEGVFCAAVEVRNFYAGPWQEVHAQLYVFNGLFGQSAYTDGLGTGAADPGTLPAPGAEKGLWRYGTIGGGGTDPETVVWTFRNDGNPFRFRGRIVGQLDEIDNGLDDDCDGVIDDELREFATGDACTDPLDCISFLCTGGTCEAGCADGMYGATCADCPGGYGVDQCFGNGSCSDGPGGDGSCTCSPGFHPTTNCEDSCSDSVRNGDETGVDCGGATCAACPAGATGIMTNVAIAALQSQGWQMCLIEPYSTPFGVTDAKFQACPGSELLLGCRTTGSPALTVAAGDSRTVVLYQDPPSTIAHHVVNGVAWYNTDNYSVGFFRPGDNLYRGTCDTSVGSAPQERLCWHKFNGSGGYRCGSTQGLGATAAWERVIMWR